VREYGERSKRGHFPESCDGSYGQVNDRGNALFRIQVEAGRKHYALRKMASQADLDSVESSLLCYTARRLPTNEEGVVVPWNEQ